MVLPSASLLSQLGVVSSNNERPNKSVPGHDPSHDHVRTGWVRRVGEEGGVGGPVGAMLEPYNKGVL